MSEILARTKLMAVAAGVHQQPQVQNKNVTANAKAHHVRFSFQQLAERRQFDKIMKILLTENRETLRWWLECDSRDTKHRSCNTGHGSVSALHRIVAFQPPGCLVEALALCLADIHKNVPEDVVDVQGLTPLHVAASHACHSDVIRRLSTGSACGSRVTAPLMPDVWSRYPLHWACLKPKSAVHAAAVVGSHDSYDKFPIVSKIWCQTFHAAATADDWIDTVRILIEAYPEATLHRDVYGFTPLDLAVKYKTDRRIIALVDSATKRVRRGRRHFKTGVWDERECMSLSATEEEVFTECSPRGFPGEISFCSRSSAHTRRNDYFKWEC